MLRIAKCPDTLAQALEPPAPLNEWRARVNASGWDYNSQTNRQMVKGGPPLAPHKPSGIRNEQARELAKLERHLGRKYSGAGLTAKEAGKAIASARQELHRRRRPTPTQ